MDNFEEAKELQDIDKLLDQVETSFLTNRTRYDPNKIVVTTEEARKCPCTVKTETNWEEIDELLKDFQVEDPKKSGNESRTKSWNLQFQEQVPLNDKNKSEAKCIPAFLAGCYEPLGYSTPGFEKACDRLGCLHCDFEVKIFDNYIWHPSTDYLFLRNHMPNFEKVSEKLMKSRGSRAYACQCQHVSINKVTNVNALHQLKWVCKKH